MTSTPTKLEAECLANLRSRINYAYAHIIGTESWERRICVEAIESRDAEIAELRQRLSSLEKKETTIAAFPMGPSHDQR